jgi:AraC-like DNA-binding protein
MEAIEQIELENIISDIGNLSNLDYSVFQDKIIMFDLDGKQSAAYDERTEYPLWKIDAFCLFIVERGECIFNIDCRTFHVGKNMAGFLTDRYIIQAIAVSGDFRCRLMLVAKDFLQNILKGANMPAPGITVTFSFFSNPVIRFEQDEFLLLQDNMERLRCNIHRKDHAFWQELVQNEFANLFFEVSDIIRLRLGKEPQKQKYTRREQVIDRFFQLLLQHSRTEREVAFYADKLCVTPVYLSRALKHAVGKSAIKVIQELVVSDAMTLLRKPEMNIQDVVDDMNFPDRETFSKFFKKNTGKSPGEFRKKAR